MDILCNVLQKLRAWCILAALPRSSPPVNALSNRLTGCVIVYAFLRLITSRAGLSKKLRKLRPETVAGLSLYLTEQDFAKNRFIKIKLNSGLTDLLPWSSDL